METLKILALAIGAAVLYGIVHDQVTIRVSLEYFTVGHPKIVATEDPTRLALVWGVVATWWMGLLLGLVLALAARAGRRPPRDARSLLRPVAVLLGIMALAALLAGVAGWLAGQSGAVTLRGGIAERLPEARHVPFLAAWWAHLASYAVGGLGGLLLAWRTWRSRRPTASTPAS